MKLESDLLVIGGGMAGLVAGTVAVESGAEVLLLRKGQSATACSSGSIDIIGYLPDATEPFSDRTRFPCRCTPGSVPWRRVPEGQTGRSGR